MATNTPLPNSVANWFNFVLKIIFLLLQIKCWPLSAPTPQNGLTNSNNSSAICLRVFDYFMGLELKELIVWNEALIKNGVGDDNLYNRIRECTCFFENLLFVVDRAGRSGCNQHAQKTRFEVGLEITNQLQGKMLPHFVSAFRTW